jgi:hypothetical protein
MRAGALSPVGRHGVMRAGAPWLTEAPRCAEARSRTRRDPETAPKDASPRRRLRAQQALTSFGV